ncbi:hypothetical protein DMI65_23780 [Escherichia coli]|nr:hypothetical protein [Escherichia coli]
MAALTTAEKITAETRTSGTGDEVMCRMNIAGASFTTSKAKSDDRRYGFWFAGHLSEMCQGWCAGARRL